jgi:hypothetical protein
MLAYKAEQRLGMGNDEAARELIAASVALPFAALAQHVSSRRRLRDDNAPLDRQMETKKLATTPIPGWLQVSDISGGIAWIQIAQIVRVRPKDAIADTRTKAIIDLENGQMHYAPIAVDEVMSKIAEDAAGENRETA